MSSAAALSPRTRRPRAAGFTAIEALVVVAITGILAALAIPSFTSAIASVRTRSLSEDLHSVFDLARHQAIRAGSTSIVTVCRSPTSQTTAPTCNGEAFDDFPANDWGAGWIAFAKGPGNADASAFEAGDEILARQDRSGPPGSAAARPVALSNARGSGQFYVFYGDGRREAGPPTITFAVDQRLPTAAATRLQRCITVTIVGRASTRPSTAACF